MLSEIKNKEVYIDYFTKTNKSFEDIQVDILTSSYSLENGKTQEETNGLVFPLYGTAKYTLEGEAYILKPGVVLHAGPDMRVSKELIGDSQYCGLILHFGVWDKEKSKYDLQNSHFLMDIGINANIIQKTNKLLYNETNIGSDEMLESEKILNYVFDDIVNALKRNKKDKLNEIPLKDIEMLNQIIEYININYDTKLSVDLLAEKFGIDSRELGYVFKKYTGTTLKLYIRELKINKAKYLLKVSDSNITEIADNLGYKDCFYFSRVFKQIVGLSPRQFREKIK